MRNSTEPKQLYVGIEETSRLGRDDYGVDGPYTGFREEYTTWSATGVFLTREEGERASNWCPDTMEHLDVEDGDEVYMLTVRYSTGSTFGREYGCGKVLALAKNLEDIEELHRLCGQHEEGYEIKIGKKLRKRVALENPEQEHLHAVWNGYFEQLEGFSAYRHIVGQRPTGEIYL